MGGEPTVIAGIPLPSNTPIFLTIVAVHVVLGIACVVTGCIAMLSPKRPGKHPTLGTTYYGALAALFGTASILSALRWAETYHLFVLGTLSFAAATLGREARRRRWRHWARIHIAGLGSSYVFLLTAFYVDNGPNLPLWNRLPSIAFWILPAAVGVPLIARALLRHPLART